VSFTAIRMAVGRVVLVAGVLILLFIPYLLWGTGLQTARSQDQLRKEFAAVQRQAGVTKDPRPVAPAHHSPVPPAVAPNIPAPAIGAPVGTIDIPKISLDMVVVSGTGTAQLEMGPGHYPGTPLPGEAGNVAIAGHRTTYLHPFYNLNELVPGDDILLTTVQGAFLYQMTSSQVVVPTDVAVVGATLTPQLTLTTCNPRYSASTRLVVHAALVASVLTHAKVPVVAKKAAPVKHPHNAPSAPAHNWFAAIFWGVIVAAVITAVWVGARRSRGSRRATVVVFGLLGWLVLVFFFFEAAAPLLPASF
jgi:sortase A